MGPNENAVIVTPTRIHPEICRTVSDRRCGPAKAIGAGADAVVERVKENSVGIRHEVVGFRLRARSYIKTTRTHTSPISALVGADH